MLEFNHIHFCFENSKRITICPIEYIAFAIFSNNNLIQKDFLNGIEFPSANLDPTFINGCEQLMTFVSHKCKFCEETSKQNGKEEIWICKTSSLCCHHWHKKESKHVRDDLMKDSIKCECQTKHPICF